MPPPSPSFFLFTKVVTHRLRKVRRMRWVDWLHGLAVMGSVVAIGASLVGDGEVLDGLTWPIVLPGSVSVSPASRLLFDVGLEDLKWNWLSRLATPPITGRVDSRRRNSPKF